MKDIESISRLFDLQKFITNKKLQSLIDEVGSKYGLRIGADGIKGGRCEISDDELEVWAAGDLSVGYRKKKTGGVIDEYE